MKQSPLVFIIGIFFLSSCSTTKVNSPSDVNINIIEEKNELTLLFAGDIMAHPEITESNYDSLLKDIEPIIKSADFAFANFESTVNDELPQSGYPLFNCHRAYAEKIIAGGFNVFSLANNHINDFHLEGLDSTKAFFDSKKDAGIYSAGIKDAKNAPIKFILIEKNGIKILFAAVTEVLNFTTELEYFDFLKETPKARQEFLGQIQSEKIKNNADILVLSFHTAEPEYERSIAEKSKNFYYSLINNGADILWINHPHVSKEWEVIHTKDNKQKIIFYSVGNTVSSQRRRPNFKKPDSPRDYTGDSFLFTVKIEKTADGVVIESPEPELITTCITENSEFVVKKLDDALINRLKEDGNEKWAAYLSERKKLMENIKGKDTWQ